MAIFEASSDTRRRIALNVVIAYVMYLVVILIAGEPINAPSLVLGLALAGFIAWLAERRRARVEKPLE